MVDLNTDGSAGIVSQVSSRFSLPQPCKLAQQVGRHRSGDWCGIVYAGKPDSMGLALTVLEGVTVQAGSQIDATGLGSGPKPETTGSSGGSYGGRGEGLRGESCPAYGDWEHPVDPGSGGIGPDDITSGGGCVRIVADMLTLDDTAWTDRLAGNETLEAAFEALQCESAAAISGAGMAVSVNGLAVFYTIPPALHFLSIAGETNSSLLWDDRGYWQRLPCLFSE